MPSPLRAFCATRAILTRMRPARPRTTSTSCFLRVSGGSTRSLSVSPLVRGGDPRNPEIKPEDEKFIVRSPYTDVEIPETNLAEFVFRDVDKFGSNVALVRWGGGEEKLELESIAIC